MSRGKPVPPCIGPGMVSYRVMMTARDVVFFKGILEAGEGIAQVFAERGGDLTVSGPLDQKDELDAYLTLLCAELGATRIS